MDLATVLLLYKSSLMVGAVCFAYMRCRSQEPGLDFLAAGFAVLAFGSTLAGWGEQGLVAFVTWTMGSFTAGAGGYALIAAGLVQLSSRRRWVGDWAAGAAALALVLLVWRMEWYADNTVRAVLFNLTTAVYLAAAALVIFRDYLRDRLPARFGLLGALLTSIVFAGLAALALGAPEFGLPDPRQSFFMLIICQFTIALFVVVLVQERAEAKLKRLANTDALTGVPNRQHFLASLPQHLQPGDAFIMLDIDHFKSINDCFGHEAGDVVLTGVAQAIAGAAGPRALLGRLGGEEFCLFLRGQTQETALAGAEQIRLAVKSLSFSPGADTITTSASLGIAVWTGTEDARALRHKADEALYLAKHRGRDKAVLFNAA